MIASSTKSITNIIDRFFDNIVKESPNIKYHTVNAILNLVHIFMMFVFVENFIMNPPMRVYYFFILISSISNP